MAHYAKVENGIVTQVIVIDAETLATGLWGDPATWYQTSYNTLGGSHPDGTPLRKNFAGVGYSYDAQLDAFIPPKPWKAWVLNTDTCLWEAPFPAPTDGKPYIWDDETDNWKEVTPPVGTDAPTGA